VFTRASAANYFDSAGVLRSAAVNTPRYQDGGLLIEQGSTNLASNSETTISIATNSVTTPAPINNAVDSPLGALTAWSIPDGATGFNQHNTVIPANTLSYTLSRYVTGTSGSVSLGQTGINAVDSLSNGQANLDLATMVVSGTAAARVKVAYVGLAGTAKWYRLSVTFVNSGAGTIFVSRETPSNIVGYASTGTQLEASATATSYIKTLAAPVTRAADICYTATANIPTLANGATFVWKGALPNDGLYHVAFRSSPNHTLMWRTANGSLVTYVGSVYMGGVAGIDTAIHTYALRTNGSNLHELLIDGVVVKTSTATGLMQPTTPIYIGSTTGTAYFLNDATQAFTMYDTSLTDAEIQGLG